MDEKASTRVEIVPASHMPASHILLPIQRDGTTTLAVREGHITPALAAAFNHLLPHLGDDGPLAPPDPG